jgi:GTPase SAR1 family protein
MKIGFCGTMSVGKTTLVNALKNVPEFKDYYFATERSKYLNSLGIPLNNDSTLKGQNIFLAERCAELMNENLITDRTIIDVIAFTKLAKSISYIDGDAFEEYAKRFIREYNYIFYISPEGIAIEDNGVRETDELYRNEIDLNIRQLLAKYQPWHHVLTGSTEERVKQVLKICFDIY